MITSLKHRVVALASNSGVLSTVQIAAQAVLQNGWSLLLPTAEERARALSALLPTAGITHTDAGANLRSPKFGTTCLIRPHYFYCPHPKDDGRLSFRRHVSGQLSGGGDPIQPTRGGEVPPSSQWCGGGGNTSSFLTGVPPSFPLFFPQSRLDGGIPPSIETVWGTPIKTGWGYPPVKTGCGYPPFSPPPPSPQSGDSSTASTCYAVAVCLLRSRRKTFLCSKFPNVCLS